jgi:hypothetical protein
VYINILILIRELKVLKKECALIFKYSYIRVSYYIASDLIRYY